MLSTDEYVMQLVIISSQKKTNQIWRADDDQLISL